MKVGVHDAQGGQDRDQVSYVRLEVLLAEGAEEVAGVHVEGEARLAEAERAEEAVEEGADGDAAELGWGEGGGERGRGEGFAVQRL